MARGDGLVPNRPGERRGGRRKGTPNKTTAQLKEAILDAAKAAGGGGDDGITVYLTKLAGENSTAFASLLGKVLPMTVSGEGGGFGFIQVIERRIVTPNKHVV
jgi:hypothetical protein